MDTETFYITMDDMIWELNDEHSAYLNPQMVAAEEAQYAGDNDYVGIGIWVQFDAEKDLAVVLLTFPGSPAEAAGIKSHDVILSVEGMTFDDEEGAALDLMLGEPNTEVNFVLQSQGEEPRNMTVTRARITSSIPVPYEALTTPGVSGSAISSSPPFRTPQLTSRGGRPRRPDRGGPVGWDHSG